MFASKLNRKTFLSVNRQLCEKLSHVDYETKLPRMVDVSRKETSNRTAHAQAIIKLPINIARELIPNFDNQYAYGNDMYCHDIEGTKGPVFATAIIAGTLGAKKTADLIPFCHPIALEKCNFKISILPPSQHIIKSLLQIPSPKQVSTYTSTGSTTTAVPHEKFIKIRIDCMVSTSNKTGVEMEALTGVSTAALCIYDMLKAMSHEIEISNIHLMEKTGGKADYKRKQSNKHDDDFDPNHTTIC